MNPKQKGTIFLVAGICGLAVIAAVVVIVALLVVPGGNSWKASLTKSQGEEISSSVEAVESSNAVSQVSQMLRCLLQCFFLSL